jgi:NADH-quinone oxidoreductase subunit J
MVFNAVTAVVCLSLVASALGVVTSKNMVHAVFWLAATLVATAGLFVVLQAPFLAGVQILLYTGGIITLMLFGVMLTAREPDTKVPNPLWRQAPASVTAALMLAVLLMAIWGTPELALTTPITPPTTLDVGRVFLTEQLIAFEALSVLLLAAMVGAIVLARKSDP